MKKRAKRVSKSQNSGFNFNWKLFLIILVAIAVIVVIVFLIKNKGEPSLSPTSCVQGALGCYKWNQNKENYYISNYQRGISGTSYYDSVGSDPFSCSTTSNKVECQTSTNGYTIGADVNSLDGKIKECVSGTNVNVAVLKGGVWDGVQKKCIDLSKCIDNDKDSYFGESTYCSKSLLKSISKFDCNDGNGMISPRQPEICNGIDDNCDGQIDEGLTFCGTTSKPDLSVGILKIGDWQVYPNIIVTDDNNDGVITINQNNFKCIDYRIKNSGQIPVTPVFVTRNSECENFDPPTRNIDFYGTFSPIPSFMNDPDSIFINGRFCGAVIIISPFDGTIMPLNPGDERGSGICNDDGVYYEKGTYTVRIKADPNNQIVESNEANNEKSYTIIVI